MPKPQTKESHAALDPLYHFTAMPLLLLATILALALAVYTVRGGLSLQAILSILWQVSISAGALLAGVQIRGYGLKLQDRLIGLEVERRYERLGGQSKDRLSEKLQPGQLVALRFASDPELVGLADEAAANGLKNRDIKQRIKTWRPDYRRI